MLKFIKYYAKRWRLPGVSLLGILGVLLLMILSACASTGSMQVKGYKMPPTHLEDNEFTLLSWNVHKSKHPDMPADLEQTLMDVQPDLVFLQEARPGSIDVPHLEGTLAVAWHHPLRQDSEVGVFTAASVEPIEREAFRSKSLELGVTVPKTSLMTLYPLPGGEELLAVNVHALNFEKGEPKRFIRQLETLHAKMKLHQGPMIFAGDFNTWNRERDEYLRELASGLGMEEVDSFEGVRKTGDHGWWNSILGIDPELPLDRVFYRGMEVVSAQILDLDASDHEPLVVTFRQTVPGDRSAVAMTE
ncbi:endonuclease/exonuclease/phosphatase family protein [Kiritimatiellota bacterium B12222]|nr:endonuclease/exonuclease/phosphatase family protein [Kiritimatiellota bacterium B12222]